MLVNVNRMRMVVSMIGRLLTSKGRRQQSGAMRWNSSEQWRLVILILYLVLMIIETWPHTSSISGSIKEESGQRMTSKETVSRTATR